MIIWKHFQIIRTIKGYPKIITHYPSNRAEIWPGHSWSRKKRKKRMFASHMADIWRRLIEFWTWYCVFLEVVRSTKLRQWADKQATRFALRLASAIIFVELMPKFIPRNTADESLPLVFKATITRQAYGNQQSSQSSWLFRNLKWLGQLGW